MHVFPNDIQMKNYWHYKLMNKRRLIKDKSLSHLASITKKIYKLFDNKLFADEVHRFEKK